MNPLQEPWNDIFKLIGVPAIATLFAFSYNIGFLLAYDIGWFPFFTISEHLLFASRALPIVVAGIVIFATFVHTPNLRKRVRWLFWPWIATQIAAALYTLATNHLALGTIFGLIAYIVWEQREELTFETPLNVLYWVANLMALSIFVGCLSGWWWKLPLGAPWMEIRLADTAKSFESSWMVGYVVFAGEKVVLFYRMDKGAILLQRSDVAYIQECPRSLLYSGCGETQSKP